MPTRRARTAAWRPIKGYVHHEPKRPKRSGMVRRYGRRRFACVQCGAPTNSVLHVGAVLVLLCETCGETYPSWEDLLPPEWMNEAACVGHPAPEPSYGEKGQHGKGPITNTLERLMWARKYCCRCPVWDECALYAKEMYSSVRSRAYTMDDVYAGLNRAGITGATDVIQEAEAVLQALHDLPPDAGGDW